jgi:hypothetical protein
MADEEISLRFTAKDEASRVADELQRKVDKLDGTTADVTAKADDKATPALKKVEKEAKSLDGKTASVKVKAVGIEKVQEGIDKVKTKLTDNLPAAASVAVAALAKFALDGANKFARLGEDIQKFAAVAGVPEETASRFVAVADDFGVGADTVSSAVGRLGSTLGNNNDALAQFGVQVVRAKDGSIDLAATTFNVIDAYNQSKSATEKDALAKAAFGKSFQELIPLMEQGSAKIKASFEDVSKTQIFDKKKIADAQAFRLAMDDLKDAVSDLQIELGRQLIPILEDTIGTVTRLSGAFNSVLAALPGDAGQKALRFVTDIMNPIKQILDLPEQLGHVRDAFAELGGGGPTGIAGAFVDLESKVKATTEAAVAGMGETAAATASATAAVLENESAHEQLKAAVARDVDRMKAKWDELRGGLTLDQELLNLEGDFADLKTAAEEAAQAAADGADDAAEKQRDYEAKVISTKLAILDLGEQIGASLNQTTTLVAQVDSGDLDRVLDRIETLRRNNKIELDIVAKAGAGFGGRLKDVIFDTGGTVGPAGGVAGERHSEILNGRAITTGPTYVPPGTKVLSSKRTRVWLRRHGLRGYDSGTRGAPIPVSRLGGNVIINASVNAAVIGSSFDLMRALQKANRDAARLLGTRKP